MIQLLLALLLAGEGGFLIWRGFTDETSSSSGLKTLIFGAVLFIPSFITLVGLSIGLLSVHVGVDSDLASYRQVKIAIRSARAGDPSYSGILLEALQWNKTIAISKGRMDSVWWGLYYNRQIAELEFIEMPGEKR